MEAGSNLVTFNTDIKFENPANEPYYYYTVAKDFEWSFLALQAVMHNSQGDLIVIPYEKVDRLPKDYLSAGTQNLTDNLLIFRIEMPADTKAMGVNEYHQNRKEPFPKTIKVYEKQTVEVYESKYYLSVYKTKESTAIFKVD